MADTVSEANDIVRQAVHDADAAVNWDYDNRIDGLRDLMFLKGGDAQWDAKDLQQRRDNGRPVITINRLVQPVNQIVNDIRQATAVVKVTAVDKNANKGTADVLGGVARYVQNKSRAPWCYAVAAGHAAACGIGHFRIKTQYAAGETFDQELAVELIGNPFSVLWEAGAKKPDRSDAKKCLVVEYMSVDAFKEQFPKASKADFTGFTFANNSKFLWRKREMVAVAEYWRMVPEKKKIGLLEDGTIIDLSQAKFLPRDLKVVREREVVSHCVYQCLVNGNEQLTEEVKWPGLFIPVVPVIGGETPLEDSVYRYGMVRHAIDPQRMYNFWRSTAAEWIGQSPKSPWTVNVDLIEEYKDYWDRANTEPLPYLPYKGNPANPQERPYRERPPEAPAALWQEGDISADEIKATMNVYDASLGNKSNEISGRAINARKSQSELANFQYADNLEISLQRAGDIFVDLIPKIYDTQRTVRILDADEKEQFVPINAVAYNDEGEQVLVNDLSAGRYEMVISIGASTATRREEAAEGMTEFLSMVPGVAEITADLVAEAQTWPGAEKFAERIRNSLPPQVLGEPAEPDPMAEAGAEAEIAEKQASADKKQADAELARAKAQREDIGAMLDRMTGRGNGAQE